MIESSRNLSTLGTVKVNKFKTPQDCGKAAAEAGAGLLRETIERKGGANVIVATGASQFDLLEALIQADGIGWDKVTVFHLDEYVGLPISHPASFRLYLWTRFQQKLPIPVRDFHYIAGDAKDPLLECKRLGNLIRECPIDLCFAGIGENGHLAFNDPPADFETEEPYLVVDLDDACRRQQFGEGWFDSLEAVPRQAISMSIRQIMRSGKILLTVPDERKALAVRGVLEGLVTNHVPASIVQEHPDVELFLDTDSASLLSPSSS